jgi:hypothetical protein
LALPLTSVTPVIVVLVGIPLPLIPLPTAHGYPFGFVFVTFVTVFDPVPMFPRPVAQLFSRSFRLRPPPTQLMVTVAVPLDVAVPVFVTVIVWVSLAPKLDHPRTPSPSVKLVVGDVVGELEVPATDHAGAPAARAVEVVAANAATTRETTRAMRRMGRVLRAGRSMSCELIMVV